MTETKQNESYAEELEGPFVTDQDGHIEISNDVIARIAGIATTEVDDVSLESKSALAKVLTGRKEPVQGILIERDPENNSVVITCSVRMAYGKDMYELAVRLRHHIKDTVEKMTRAIVSRVDIKIVGIILSEPHRREVEEEEEE
ncbi:Asp23/Gls24 family envelope stress response protein [bacterium]|nr:Asp23/Gls24 family envelope stress response protein [bacterium]